MNQLDRNSVENLIKQSAAKEREVLGTIIRKILGTLEKQELNIRHLKQRSELLEGTVDNLLGILAERETR
jgi:hypothetical protein